MLVGRCLRTSLLLGIACGFDSHFRYAFFAAADCDAVRQFLRAQKRFYPCEILFCFAKTLQRFGLSVVTENAAGKICSVSSFCCA